LDVQLLKEGSSLALVMREMWETFGIPFQGYQLADFEKRIAEGKNIGHDAITITLTDIIECVKIENLVCWLHGSRIDPTDFFNKLTNKEIKINQ
jgi:hypothetical protein